MKNWKLNGWRLKSGGPITNKEDFVELDGLNSEMDVVWVNIRDQNPRFWSRSYLCSVCCWSPDFCSKEQSAFSVLRNFWFDLVLNK